MVVGWGASGDPDVYEFDDLDGRSGWARTLLGRRRRLLLRTDPLSAQAARFLRLAAEPGRELGRRWGREDMRFPASHRVLDLTPVPPNILHCHNLHGGYFDLRVLPELSRRLPVVLTLHDAWLLGGHCAHSLECQLWSEGCGACSQLDLYPAAARDSTAYNWRRKAATMAASRVRVAAPSSWLLRQAETSLLAPAIVESRVIPNGVDLDIFRPGSQAQARRSLGIDPHLRVLVFAAAGVRSNPWKDVRTLERSLEILATGKDRLDGPILLLALGEEGPSRRIGRGAELRFVPYQDDAHAVAEYYRAADVYLHPARAETFGNSILEAAACGIPVVASEVGGIPEQVESLWTRDGRMTGPFSRAATGILAPAGDVEGMAEGVRQLLTDRALAAQLGANGAERARRHYGLDRQVDAYLDWYRAILDERSAGGRPAHTASS